MSGPDAAARVSGSAGFSRRKVTGMITRPVQINFCNMAASPALESEVRSRVAWLESFYPEINRCRIVIEIPHRHRRRGRSVHVRIELSVPGDDVIVNRAPVLRDRDAYVAVHHAFDIARRRLEDLARRQRGDVKVHAEAS